MCWTWHSTHYAGTARKTHLKFQSEILRVHSPTAPPGIWRPTLSNPFFPQHSPENPEGCEGPLTRWHKTRNPGAWCTLVAYTAQEPAYLLSPRTSLFLVPRWSYDFPCCLLTGESSLLDISYMVSRLLTMALWRWKPHISPKAIRQTAEKHRAFNLGFSRTIKPYKSSAFSEISNAKS